MLETLEAAHLLFEGTIDISHLQLERHERAVSLLAKSAARFCSIL
jgi:hypothetical protein